MNNEKRYETRSDNKKRFKGTKRKKLDRLLNVLIAIVSILIVLNLVSIFTDKNKNEQEKEPVQSDVNSNKTSEDVISSVPEENGPNDAISPSTDENLKAEAETQTDNNENDQEITTQSSDDPIVDEVIINPNWQPTPTEQTGEHISTYEEGHIDYEEKLKTIRNAVQLDEDNIIYWSVKSSGGPNSAVAVVSSKDSNRTEKYRVYIEWIENKGWKPMKVEKLNQLAKSF